MLNGGLPGKFTPDTPMDEFVFAFVNGISRAEWEFVHQVFGSPDVITVITAVTTFRATRKYPLPPDHPLNPASRFTESAA